MDKIDVQFVLPESFYEDEQGSCLLKITLTLECGIVFDFSTNRGELYSAEEYEEFGKGDMKLLDFNDVWGCVNIRRVGSAVLFTNTSGSDTNAFSIPSNLCIGLFEKVAIERRKVLKSPPSTFQDIVAKRIYLGYNRDAVMMMKCECESQTLHWSLPGFNKEHVEALYRMADGETLVIEVESQESSDWSVTSTEGGRFETDGVYLMIGFVTQSKLGPPRQRYSQSQCREFLRQLAYSL